MAMGGLSVRVNGKKATCSTGGKRRKGRKAKASGGARKPCQKQNGRLKKGWRYGKNGRCIKAKD